MVERGEHPGLTLEPRQTLGVAGERAGQHLDRNVAAELGIASAIHLAHAAHAEPRTDLVDADPLTDQPRTPLPDIRSSRSVIVASFTGRLLGWRWVTVGQRRSPSSSRCSRRSVLPPTSGWYTSTASSSRS